MGKVYFEDIIFISLFSDGDIFRALSLWVAGTYVMVPNDEKQSSAIWKWIMCNYLDPTDFLANLESWRCQGEALIRAQNIYYTICASSFSWMLPVTFNTFLSSNLNHEINTNLKIIKRKGEIVKKNWTENIINLKKIWNSINALKNNKIT